ncbi:MAG TPA: cation:proton antiporter [Ktedonobacterales bacterium]|jgi:Kef-type K+ transport system membrane component KefB|nr:cation:proton antiporter [Ktedonobacterales bacterium]
MQSLTEQQLLFALLGIAVILLVGRSVAELARRIGQPEVLGELLGGVLLGPSVFGALFPGAYRALFLAPAISAGLSLFSWVGAILLLMVAGIEVDLKILRDNARPNTLTAIFAIVPSIIAGTVFAMTLLGRPLANGLFLGLTLSVTGVSVIAKILIERDALRRTYAQVIIAAGVASEVIVWLLISVVSNLSRGTELQSGARALVFAVAFFVFMMTLGRRFTNWAMRRTADLTSIMRGEVSVALVLAFISAAITQALGLHALLGAFVFGVLLGQAPRANEQLKERIQTLVVGVFAPIFFVLAGMRVDIFKVGSFASIGLIALLFVIATSVKVIFGAIGARLGGMRPLESALVGVGVDLRGGTDVIVAILGAELGLLTVQVYTLYACVAILTVLAAPFVIDLLERRTPPSREELARLNDEEARRRAYLSHMERVLAPNLPELQPAAMASLIEQIARAKKAEGEVFDITQLVMKDEAAQRPATSTQVSTQAPGAPADGATSIARRRADATQQAHERLSDVAEDREVVEVTRRTVVASTAEQVMDAVLETSADHDLVAIGARAPRPGGAFTLGALQDRIIDEARADVLLLALPEGQETFVADDVKRILVVVNGFEFSLAAADVVAYLAKATGAELTLFAHERSRLDSLFWREGGHREQLRVGYQRLRELSFRLGRLNVPLRQRVTLGNDPGKAIVHELKRGRYDLVALGAIDRSVDHRLDLGAPVEVTLAQGRTPTLVLVTHE